MQRRRLRLFRKASSEKSARVRYIVTERIARWHEMLNHRRAYREGRYLRTQATSNESHSTALMNYDLTNTPFESHDQYLFSSVLGKS